MPPRKGAKAAKARAAAKVAAKNDGETRHTRARSTKKDVQTGGKGGNVVTNLRFIPTKIARSPSPSSPPPQKLVLDRSRSSAKSTKSGDSSLSSGDNARKRDATVVSTETEEFDNEVPSEDQDYDEEGCNDGKETESEDEGFGETLFLTNQEFKREFQKFCPSEEECKELYAVMSKLSSGEVNEIKSDFETMSTWPGSEVLVEYIKCKVDYYRELNEVTVTLAKTEDKVKLLEEELSTTGAMSTKIFEKMDKKKTQ